MCCIRKDLLKTQHFLGLILCTATNITARIPLQSAARTSHADSFSPGEAVGAAAPLDKGNNNFSSHQPFSCIFSLFALKYYHYLFEVIPFVFS